MPPLYPSHAHGGGASLVWEPLVYIVTCPALRPPPGGSQVRQMRHLELFEPCGALSGQQQSRGAKSCTSGSCLVPSTARVVVIVVVAVAVS